MNHRCPYCGVELKIINNRWYCPNHGFIDENKEDSGDCARQTYFG